jgi:nucleotide-binding universal stress UspA family protein
MPTSFNRILVCLDGSGFAEQIIPYAATEAKLHQGAIVLLRALTTAGIIVDTVSVGYVSSAIDDQLREDEAIARKYLEEVAEPLRADGFEVTCIIIPGPPGEAIVEYACREQVSLIAMATHGRGGLGRLVLGSIADHVVKHSGLPILLIKPKKDNKPE